MPIAARSFWCRTTGRFSTRWRLPPGFCATVGCGASTCRSARRAPRGEAGGGARRGGEGEERKIEAVRASAKRLATWGRDFDNEKFARRAKSMEKRAERMEAEKTFVTEGSPLDLTLDLAAVRSKEVVRVEDLRVAPSGAPEHRLFDIDQFLIRPGERVALLGANGVGKSTFIRMLIGAFR